MTSATGLFVRVGAEVRGPYGLEQLRQLAEVGVITPATEAATAPAGPWEKMATLADAARLFPRRAELGFKPAEFAVENQASTRPVDHHELIAYANQPLTPANAEAMRRAAEVAKGPAAPNEVELIVQEVGRRDALFQPPPPPPPKWRPSRRLKFCVAVALAGNAVLVAIPFVYEAFDDDMSMTILRGWVVLFNGAVAALYSFMRFTDSGR